MSLELAVALEKLRTSTKELQDQLKESSSQSSMNQLEALTSKLETSINELSEKQKTTSDINEILNYVTRINLLSSETLEILADNVQRSSSPKDVLSIARQIRNLSAHLNTLQLKEKELETLKASVQSA